MSNQQEMTKNKIISPVAKLAILLFLWIWAFWPEISTIMATGLKSSESVYVLTSPIAILLMVYLRRKPLMANMTEGSPWGLVILIISLGLYSGTIWPFNYWYVRCVSIVPVLSALVLVTCGWHVLKLSFPMQLMVMLSIPIPTRLYATLIIRPETYTIAAVTTVLCKLPGIDVLTKGVDMIFSSDHYSGTIALGESNRGARLLLTFASVGAFVVFSRIRPFTRLVLTAIAALPVVMFCNFFRLFCWGLVVIYAQLSPISALPKNISMICSLFLLYGIFVLLCTVKPNLFVNVEKDINNKEHSCA